jgi:hypothetical protein
MARCDQGLVEAEGSTGHRPRGFDQNVLSLVW